MKLGIVGALDIEVDFFKDEMEIDSSCQKAGMIFYEGQFKGVKIVLVKSGVGKVNAAICTQILINDFKVEQIIFTGVAGAIDRRVAVGDIVVAEDLVQHDIDATGFDYKLGEVPGLDQVAFTADKKLLALAKEAGKKITAEKEIDLYSGRILSGDQFISDQEKVAELKANFGGYCTEMEGAALAQVCFLNDIPFVVVRSISDNADQEAGHSFVEFVKEAANNSYAIVAEMIGALK